MSASPRSSFPPIPQHHHVSLRTETVGPERRHPRSWEQQIFQWNNAEDFDKDIFHLDQILIALQTRVERMQQGTRKQV